MNGKFNDHFGKVAEQYADFRPHYPAALFSWLASQCKAHECVWDCGAGNGQASVPLADFFSCVHATDASASQVAQSLPHPRIHYRVANANASGLDSHCVDLITVAQALHWFDLDRFYAEARRVLKSDGVIAAWSYGMIRVEGADVDTAIQHFYRHTIGPYWPPERRHVENGYRDLDFPFQLIDTPPLSMSVRWTLDQLLGYLRSWSASARYFSATGKDPAISLAAELLPIWGGPGDRRQIEWPLSLLAGRT